MGKHHTYSHEELMGKLDEAYQEIKRLRQRPDHSKIIDKMQDEINELYNLINNLVEQRRAFAEMFYYRKAGESGVPDSYKEKFEARYRRIIQ